MACSGNAELEDIEDLRGEFIIHANQPGSNGVIRHVKRSKMSKCLPEADSFIPGTQRVYVKTWGCSHNNSDSEYMAGQLAANDDKKEADLWLLNSCTVKNPAEDHLKNEINLAKKLQKSVVIAGCVSQAAPNSQFLYGLSIVGVQQIDRVVEVVEETLKGNSVRLLSQKKENGKKCGGASLLLPKIRKNPLIEIIPINTGCLNQCTYCKTKHARGNLGSYSIQEIVERAQQAFSEGVVEIWLTSEDTGAYGRDIGVTLPDLLWQLVKVIPVGCMLRLGMTNPPYILDHLEEMSKIFALPCVYGFLHVPVQSGSDQVLSDMKREYFVSDFEKVVDFLKEKVPGITIATDIICGFPTETEEDFEGTVQLIEKYKFPSLFINQFYPRPNTPAAKMPRIATQIVKQRTKRLSRIFEHVLPYTDRLGSIQHVLITEVAHDKKHYVGHNKYYEQILLRKEDDLLGKMCDVEITFTGKHYMMGTRLKRSKPSKPCSLKALKFAGSSAGDFVFYALVFMLCGLDIGRVLGIGPVCRALRSHNPLTWMGSVRRICPDNKAVWVAPCPDRTAYT
uniref:tRNA-t(6)A37 methylthiotransferase n=1 Tax=Strigamia maritima TaxID=126957 RepID=T1J4Q2_STRMM